MRTRCPRSFRLYLILSVLTLLTKITNPSTLSYYLDDDNTLHPNLFKSLDHIDNDKIYTFDQYNRFNGNNISVGYIDTANLLLSLAVFA